MNNKLCKFPGRLYKFVNFSMADLNTDMLKDRASTHQELYLALGWLSEELRKCSAEEQSSILILDSVRLN